ncbi:Rho GTPase activator [Lasiodiplodia theobromae]|uniref:Rho-type GTPase-activating protein 1 n=1 Tax=Lasiodiplodia theobromae TaxID=45133 RepID=A0A5N5D8H3_9PEZI|nr:Rho GTPase activator [Lasiodiplodia theobromae]KAB2574058.1 Rho-type GTPase-activating protein 1 [Lasiodiplodia theobromae]KAF4536574.1 Rho GTPase activator [Lasiodiplodia theobromae]
MATPSEGPPSRDGLAPPDDAALGPGDMANNNTQDERERSRRLENGGDSSRPSRERSRNGSRRPSGSRVCGKCGGHLTGQFVRALGDTFHLECFTCHDCDKIVASKFFPVPEQGPNQYPLCETDYFRRLDLLCFSCGGALRGSYITALDRKYHIEHFTCSVCPTVFGAQDSYYEHDGSVYCHFHYSTKFAQRCNGCQTAILKQFVEIFRNGQNQHWHPECYMIHKFWNVRLHTTGQPVVEKALAGEEDTDELRKDVRMEEEKIEERVNWIWKTLSAFEERSATCISDMLLHVSNGAYFDGVLAARRFIVHIDLLFEGADELDKVLVEQTPKGLSYSREAKLLCKKVVAFFQLLAQSQDTGVRRLGVTQELLSLVTGLAHYLKLLIRICLQGALKLERETGSASGLSGFMDQINSLESKLEQDTIIDTSSESVALVQRTADTCPVCDKPVEDKCFMANNRVFHVACMKCRTCDKELRDHHEARWSPSSEKLMCASCAASVSDAESGFVQVTRLRQYVHLLRVAHARLLATLRTSGALPHTSDDPNLMDYDSNSGHRVSPAGSEPAAEPPLLRSDTRSKSYTGHNNEKATPSSYEQTLGDIRRLRSTRLDKHLSQTMKRARTSRVMDGPEGIRPGSAGDAQRGSGPNNMTIEQGRDYNETGPLTFGTNGGIALDDIPRIVAAEQAKDQRPNAAKRDVSGAQELEKAAAGEGHYGKKYFSELTALEYFIVRHVAVLSMEPLLEGHFNQEELLELIENQKRPTFWGKFGKAFKGNEKPKGGKRKGVFGKSLEYVVEKDGAESTDCVGPGTLKVPALVQDAVSAMRTMDMSVEGVFRKNGNIKRLRELTEEIDAKGGDAVDLTRESPVQVAALLKKFLRELPDPVMTFKLHRLFITGAKIQDEDKRRRVLHLTCCLMPKVHRDTMEVLFTFLNWVSSFHTVDEETGSKMDIHNLATVIAPNILYSSTKSPDMDSSFLAIEAVHSLIQCNESMCEVPEDLQSILADSSMFDLNAELTTKEILKRVGELGKIPQATVPGPQQANRNSGSRSSAPVVARIESDPASYQAESSVRHVGGQRDNGELGPPQPPYGNASSDSHSDRGSPSRYRENRSSQYQRPGVGVTGAG